MPPQKRGSLRGRSPLKICRGVRGGAAPPGFHTNAYLGYRFGIGLFGIQVWDWVIWDTGLGLGYLGYRFWDLGYLGYRFCDLFVNTLFYSYVGRVIETCSDQIKHQDRIPTWLSTKDKDPTQGASLCNCCWIEVC